MTEILSFGNDCHVRCIPKFLPGTLVVVKICFYVIQETFSDLLSNSTHTLCCVIMINAPLIREWMDLKYHWFRKQIEFFQRRGNGLEIKDITLLFTNLDLFTSISTAYSFFSVHLSSQSLSDKFVCCLFSAWELGLARISWGSSRQTSSAVQQKVMTNTSQKIKCYFQSI